MEPRGEVYDLGYQHYDGPREGRTRARKAVFWNGVRNALGVGRGSKAKVLPVLLFGSAMVPALIYVLILAATGLDADFVPSPGEYYEVISLVMFIFGAILAPEMLSPDRRERVIDLYLVRPLTVTDYLLGRVLAFFAIVLALVYSGQIMLQVGLLLVANDPADYFRDNWLDIPRFMAGGVLVALFITIVPLAVSAFTTRRIYATAFVIGLFMISLFVSAGLTSTECRSSDGRFQECEPVTGEAAKWFALISVRDIPLRVSDQIFNRESDNPSAQAASELNEAIPGVVYALVTGGLGGLLLWRYRRIAL